MPQAPQRLGLWSGVGLVVANMIGTGVFVSAGYQAQDLGPGLLLFAWVVGSAVALCGARAYAELATLLPRSGGEYRFLSELMHPLLGYLAGWATLLVGFAAPVAVNALAAAAFTATLLPVPDEKLLASAFVLALTALHARDFGVSRLTQDALVAIKALLVLGFVAMGLLGGRHHWPDWTPPHAHAGFPTGPFVTSLFFIAFAFSGWNAAAYSAEEFQQPRRDVPRAMALGCLMVAAFYLLANWVFVANLTPERAAVVFQFETQRVTLGHLIASDVLGPVGGRAMSVLAVLSFLSAISAMVFVGPRVYAAMADDGYLPRVLASRAGRPPTGSVWLQGLVTLALLHGQGLRELLANVGAILTLISGLTVLGLFRAARLIPGARPARLALLCAGAYALAATVMLWVGLRGSRSLVLWTGALVVVTAAGWAGTRWLGGGRPRVESPR